MRHWLSVVALVVSLSYPACKAPQVPPEVKEAYAQEDELWRVGASVYLPQDYADYKGQIAEAKERLIREKAKFPWFRHYENVEEAYRSALNEGERILEETKKIKEEKSHSIASQLKSFKNHINSLRQLSIMMNGGGLIRAMTMRADLMLTEANLLYERRNFLEAEMKLKNVALHVSDADNFVSLTLARYQDEALIEEWRKWVEETISESGEKGIAVIIITKIDRRLTLYERGRLILSFGIGMGRNGLFDKLHIGDYATPEGRYRVKDKLPSSQYYKALLIDYPNHDDRERFYLNRKKGLIPAGVSIGGSIEIHGGGNDSLTDGCISLENDDMDLLFSLAEVGTPVAIVGSLSSWKEILVKENESSRNY